MNTKLSKIIFLIVMIFSLSSCSTRPNPVPTTEQVGTELPLQTYPDPDVKTNDNDQSDKKAYPQPAISVNSAYPGPEFIQPPQEMIVPFILARPVREGDLEVSGTGPPGLPVLIAYAMAGDEILGEGVVELDGEFLIVLSLPLKKAYRIGVAIGDLSGTQWESFDFSDQGFFGPEFRQVPFVGFFYDTVLVTTK